MRGKPLGSGQRSQRRRIIPAHAGQTYVTSDGNNNGPDHPRACGANSLPMTFIIDRNGSSPRMRGKLGHVHDRAGEARIIPAHAGQTFRRSASCTRWPDHPRACGANACATSSDISRSGSSPRMRGKLELRKQPDGRVRIIPAHAGQTPTSPSEAPATSDHPRACGANPLSLSHRAVTPGSSPRMRGKLAGHAIIHGGCRIIPAHAGQTDPASAPTPITSDHPRACGANSDSEPEITRLNGSSPRMRGKHRGTGQPDRPVRIIPAHAGQTQTRVYMILPNTDHPRACGANIPMVLGIDAFRGSSPRMRGKLPRPFWRPSGARIIPAHAGQTRPWSGSQCWKTDHPRACGANNTGPAQAAGDIGSSPRMRGKLPRIRGPRGRGRIIPAHAGQTPRWTRPGTISPDHPRACGANDQGDRFSKSADGSSPRMRGKQSDFMRKLLSAGPSIIGFAQWLQSSYYCSCLQSSAKTPISRGTTPTSLFLGFQNSITLLLLT